MPWLGHICFGQLCYKSNCGEQRCSWGWRCLKPAGIQNEPWLEPSACASQLPGMLQSCWSVANMLSSLRILRKVKEQRFNIKHLNQSRVEFPRAKIHHYPEGIPCAEYKYLLPKNGGVIPSQRRVMRILCKVKG